MTTPSLLEAPPLRLDVTEARVWLNDKPVHLGAKPFDLLRALMERPDRLVSKEELIDIVWQGRPVSDAVLTTAIRDLRRELGDDARAPTFIQTVHGRGYRFLRPRSTEATSQGGENHSQPKATKLRVRIALAIGIVLFAAALFQLGRTYAPTPREQAPDLDDGAIAVLPFADLSQAGDQGYFSEGLADEILTALIAVEGLKVTSRTSSFIYRERGSLSVPDIARELGVRHLLEGSVRREGDSLRVNVQLIDALDDRHTWSERYDRDITVENILAIQDEIATAIVDALGVQLNETLARRDIRATSAAAGTSNLAAYEAYLAGRELFVDRRDIDRAIAFARVAVEQDPRFARGWELLAASAFVASGRPTGEAQNAVATAMLLDPTLSLAQALQAVIGNINPPYDWQQAIARLERAVELNPKNTTALLWLGLENRKLGYLDRAEAILDRCLEIDPAYHRCRLHRLYTLHMNGKTTSAINDYRRLVADGRAPDDDVLLLTFLRAGETATARAVLASLSDGEPVPERTYDALLSDSPAQNEGLSGELREWVRAQSTNRRDFYSLLFAFKAYDLIEVEQGSYFGLWLPEFPEFRQSQFFKDFVKAMGIDRYWRSHGFPPQCQAVSNDSFVCE